jgi:hypothetical protein
MNWITEERAFGYFISHSVLARTGGQPFSYPVEIGSSSSGHEAAAVEADHSSPTSAKDEKVWR